jgi:hypothetical protein
MKRKKQSVMRVPETFGNGVIIKSRFFKSTSGLEDTIHLELCLNDKILLPLIVPCSKLNSSSMSFVTPKIVGEEVYYEKGFYVESTSNRPLGDYVMFKIESGQFKGASFP